MHGEDWEMETGNCGADHFHTSEMRGHHGGKNKQSKKTQRFSLFSDAWQPCLMILPPTKLNVSSYDSSLTLFFF